jgi:hypothetical protein
MIEQATTLAVTTTELISSHDKVMAFWSSRHTGFQGKYYGLHRSSEHTMAGFKTDTSHLSCFKVAIALPAMLHLQMSHR